MFDELRERFIWLQHGGLGANYWNDWNLTCSCSTIHKIYCKCHFQVFQRRRDGSVQFNKTWDYYANGFGNPSQEFWLGKYCMQRRYRGRETCSKFRRLAWIVLTSFDVCDEVKDEHSFYRASFLVVVCSSCGWLKLLFNFAGSHSLIGTYSW